MTPGCFVVSSDRVVNQDPIDERALWNEKFGSGSHASPEPDPFLLRAYRDYLEPIFCDGNGRKALDLAGGAGRNARLLAERGWEVTLLDISEKGLELARREAEKRGASISLRREDARSADLGREQFDLIIVFFFLERDLFAGIRDALKPGGVLIYKTYTAEHPRLSGGKGPQHPMHLLKPNELLHLALSRQDLSLQAPDSGGRIQDRPQAAQPALQILFYRETVMDKGVAELVAQK